MENPQPSRVDGCSGFKGINSPASSLTADKAHLGILNEVVKAAHGIGAAAHAGDYRIRQLALLFQDLCPGLPGDHCLEIPDNGGKGMGSHYGAKAIVGVINPAGPLPHGLGNRIFQRGGSSGHRHHLGPQQLHSVHVQCLAPGILLAHEHHAFHIHQCSGGGSCHTMPRSFFGFTQRDAHFLGKQYLT